jgi:hypothetical protein
VSGARGTARVAGAAAVAVAVAVAVALALAGAGVSVAGTGKPAAKSPKPPPGTGAPESAAHVTTVGNVAAVVTAAAGADRFTADYVAELVLAGAGGSGTYRTVPPEILGDALGKLGKDGVACAADDACVRALAAALNLHHLLIATLGGKAAAATLAASIVTPATVAVDRKVLPPVPGGEDAVVVAAPTLGETLAAAPPLALVRLDGPAGMTVKLDGAALGAAPLAPPVLRIAAGDHVVALEKAGRAPWSTPVKVEGGKRYLLRWKE